ncbi:hypothetical protein [Leptospira koniambonensis]|uniref:hypothetical protein n=1 Tax=Leptospira koniambonensis TaxID=2484950 RepID=UPI001FC98103|nr:hypothetical protein [Leptospira koniambonensis]
MMNQQIQEALNKLNLKKLEFSFQKFQSLASKFLKRSRNIKTRRILFKFILRFAVSSLKKIFVTIIMLEIGIAPLSADPTIFRDLWKNGSDGKLERQYERANNSGSEADWNDSVNKGFSLLRADWEASADRAIEKNLLENGGSSNTALKDQLLQEKALVRSEWEEDVQEEIENRKGQWKAKVASGSLEDTLENIDKGALIQAVLQAGVAAQAGTNASEKAGLFDSTIKSFLTSFRSNWETDLNSRIEGIQSNSNLLSNSQKLGFETALSDIKKNILAEYYYEENSIVAAYRANFVAKANAADDINGQIAQETDPNKLALLLIERAQKSAGDLSGLVTTNTSTNVDPNTIVSSGDDYQSKFLAALQSGQKQWQDAIDQLVLGKLRYDKEVELQWKSGEADWANAYNQILKAKSDWTQVVNAQIQKGLQSWDESEAQLKANKEKALAELDRTLATQSEQWQAHVRGIESIVVGGADTLTTIESNIQFFQGAITRAEKPNSGYPASVVTEYRSQLSYWQSLETRVRDLVKNSGNTLHDDDVRGADGLLSSSGIYTSQELELRIAQAELKVLQENQTRAQSVYDYAAANVGNKTAAQLEAELASVKADFETKQNAYLALLAELNGSSASSTYSQTGLDSSSSTTTGGSSSTNPTSILTDLEAANKVLEDKRKALELARSELMGSQNAYDSTVKMQVLIQNPELLGSIGELKTDGSNKTDSGLRYEIEQASEELERQREVLRQQEAAMYKLTYERENALRTQTFYNQSLSQILAFEDVKEKKAALEKILSGDGTLSEKIDSLLSGDTLVSLYGNTVAVQIQKDLTSMKSQLANLDTPVVDSSTTFDSQVQLLNTASTSFPVDDLTAKKSELTNYLNQLKNIRSGFGSISSYDTTYLGLDRVDQGIAYLENLLGQWDTNSSAMEDGFSKIEDKTSAYKDYISANSNLKGTAEYSNRILGLVNDIQGSAIQIGQFQSFVSDLNQTTSYLNTVLLDVFQRGGTVIDSSLTGTDRTNAKNDLAGFKSLLDSSSKDWSPVVAGMGSSFGDISSLLGNFGNSIQAFRSSLETRNNIASTVSGKLLSFYESFQTEYLVRKDQLNFLLDPDGDSESLQALKENAENRKNIEGAKINEKALEILHSYLADLPSDKRNFSSIYLQVLKDSDSNSLDLDLDPDSLLNRKALEVVLSFFRTNGNSISNQLASSDYEDWISSLEEEMDAAGDAVSFYEGGGKYTAAQRTEIRESGSSEEKRLLNESYNFGSTFFFGSAVVSKISSLDQASKSISAFATQVSTNGVLSALTDDYFESQENKTTGLLSEIRSKVSGLSDITASDLLQDSFNLGTNIDHNTEEEDFRKNLLAEYLSGKSTTEDFFLAMSDLSQISNIFGSSIASSVYSDASKLNTKYTTNLSAYTLASTNLVSSLNSVDSPVNSALSLFSDDRLNYFSGQLSSLQGIYGLKDFQDAANPGVNVFTSEDFSSLGNYISSVSSNLSNWNSAKTNLESAYSSYNDAKTALSSLTPGSDTFLDQSDVVLSKFNDLKSAYLEAQGLLQIITGDTQSAYTESRNLVSQMKVEESLPSTFLLNATTLALAPSGILAQYNTTPANFTYFDTFQSSPVELLISQEMGVTLGMLGLATDQSNLSSVFALSGGLDTVSNNLQSVSKTYAALQTTKGQVETFQDGLSDKIVVYLGEGSKNQIGQDDLISYVKQLRDFFITKQQNGEQVNSAILTALENAGTYTDEIENLKYFSSIAVADRTESNLNTSYSTAKDYTATVTEAKTIFADLQSTLKALQDSGQPVYNAMSQIESSLIKFDKLQAKLSGTDFELDSDLVSGIQSLKEYAWEIRKEELGEAFLSELASNISLDQFMTEIRSGKQWTADTNPNSTNVYALSKNTEAKFLGQSLTESQISEIFNYLKVYRDQAKVLNSDLSKGIESIVLSTDPEVKAALNEQALALGYERINNSLSQGVFANSSSYPPELANYALVSNFSAYLGAMTYAASTKNETVDKNQVLRDFLLNYGISSDAQSLLENFVSNFDSRNSSYYLPDSLKERDLAYAYYYRSATENLSPDDMNSLTTWLKDKKYEPGLVTSLNRSVRMDFVLNSYLGDSDEEYLSFVNNKLQGGLSDSEKQGFVLYKAGLYSPFGSLDPLSSIQSDFYLKNYQHETGFSDLISSLGAENLNLTLELTNAQASERKAKYAYDVVKGNVVIESYLSYVNIGSQGQTAPTLETQITNKERELEYQAEQRLGNLLSLIESYKSYSFDPDKTEANPSIRQALKEIQDSGYEISDDVYEKNQTTGTYDFIAGINNLKGIIDNYVDNNLPGRVAINDPYAETSKATGAMSSYADNIMESGKKIGILTDIANKYSGLSGDALKSALGSELGTIKTQYSLNQQTFEDAEAAFTTQQNIVKGIQSQYAAKQVEVSAAYTTMETASAKLSEKSAVYDFATLKEYSAGVTDLNATELAKTRLTDANDAVTAKLKEITDLQNLISKQTTLASLNADPQVKENQKQTEEWAERALRFSQAEKTIKDKMTDLKNQIDTERANLQGYLNEILVPTNYKINGNGLDGKIDYQKSDYITLESDLRQQYQIMEGVIGGYVGLWDFVNGGRGSTSGALTYGGGLNAQYPQFSILDFVNSHGGSSGLAPQMKTAMNAFDGMWWLDPYSGATAAANNRLSSVTYSEYSSKMETSFSNQMGAEAILIAIMGWGNPTVGLEAINRTNTWVQQKGYLQTGLDSAQTSAQKLKDLQAELNYYTDISSKDQLKSVLLGSGNEEGKYTLNTGLQAGDLDYLTGTGTFDNGTLSWTGGKEPLNMDKIAGKNGNSVVQKRYVHDAYGLLVRDDGDNAGGVSATITGSSDGIKTATMTSADEFVSALAVLSQSQYEIERDEYFAAQEKYIGAGGQKADPKTILDAREQFYSDLLKKLSNNNGENIEYDMYKKVAEDYMGKGKIIDQLFLANQKQQYALQTAVWDQKEQDFYQKKQEWVENIQFLQNAGLSKFNDMTNTILQGWDSWRTEFKKKAKEGEKAHVDQIATMISEKAAWEKDFISTYKDQSDTDKLAEAYKQIQSLIESYKKDLPTEVGVELNANAILNKVLAGAPSKFDDNLINQGAYQDVQFFIDQVKTQKLDDSNLKQFQDMSKEMEERSQKLVVLQSLDSLYNIPKTYEETIGAANKDLGKQLTQKVMRDGFMPVGDLLIRQTVGADGQPQQQILPNYTIYGYEGPKQLPKVKDSDGKEWDLSNFNALAADGGPSTAELQQMVKLAISVLDKDFKKTYDPVNQENREEKIAALDPVAMAKVMQASQGALRSLLSDPQYMAASASDKKYMEQNAMSSGYLVGPTEGGVFGDWHFNQFYTSLKLKEKYDSLEAKGKELNSDGFSNAVGSAVQLYTQGAIYGLGAMAALATGPWAIYLAPKIMEVTQNAVDQTKNIKSDTANFMHENKDTIDAAAAIAAVVTGPVGMIAFAAYKATQGAFEGGALGFVAGAANIGNAYLQGMTGGSLSYEMSYSYKDGFGVSVGGGYRIADGLAIGGSISYNANSGSINGSVGLQNRFDASGRFTGNLGVNFDNTGFTGVSAGVGIGLGNQDKEGNFAGSLNLGLSYDRNDGFGQSAGISENTNKFAPQSSFDYNHTAWGGNTYSVTTPSVAGITGTYSYNDVTQGYTASLSANSATALTYDSISGDAVYNKGFFGDMGKAQGLALGAMTKDQYDKYVNDQTEVRTKSQGLWDTTISVFDGWFSSESSPDSQASRSAQESARRNLADDMIGGLAYRGAGIGEDDGGLSGKGALQPGEVLKTDAFPSGEGVVGPNGKLYDRYSPEGMKYYANANGMDVSTGLARDYKDSESRFQAALAKIDSEFIPQDNSTILEGVTSLLSDKIVEKIKEFIKGALSGEAKKAADIGGLMDKMAGYLKSTDSLTDLYRPILDDVRDLYRSAQSFTAEEKYNKVNSIQDEIDKMMASGNRTQIEAAYEKGDYKNETAKLYDKKINSLGREILGLDGLEAGLNINDRLSKQEVFKTLKSHLDSFMGYGDEKFIKKVEATTSLLEATKKLEYTYSTYKYLQANNSSMIAYPKDVSGLTEASMNIVQNVTRQRYLKYIETLNKAKRTDLPMIYMDYWK